MYPKMLSCLLDVLRIILIFIMTDIDDVAGTIDDVDVPEFSDENGDDTNLTETESEDSLTDHQFDDEDMTETEKELKDLEEKVSDTERSDHLDRTKFTGKVCPTSHGCSGATSCDLSYGDYPY